MRLGILVNTLASESEVGQTSYRLGLAAAGRGHEVFVMSAGAFASEPGGAGRLRVWARSSQRKRGMDVHRYMRAVRGSSGSWIDVDSLDVLLLRSNPSAQTPWAQRASLHFGRLAAELGVIVLNDPEGLGRAANKLYMLGFPAHVQPATLVTRSLGRIARFARDHSPFVIKPLQGSGGQGVFLVDSPNDANFESIYRATTRDGYAVVQEYLPGARDGDTRLFLMNGVPLEQRGHFAAVRRVPSGDDPRANVHVGARIRRARVSEAMLRVAAAVRERLVADGMFLVGLDLVDDRILEINVFSPGGLGSAETIEKTDFCETVIEALERKVALRAQGGLRNVELATRG